MIEDGKDTFTLDDLAIRLFILPNTKWNYVKIERGIKCLLRADKLQDMEPAKYKAVRQDNSEGWG
jgi:hypothetical protein